jgi:hypothetical protein
MSTLAELMFSPLPDDATAAQQRNWVTYTPLTQDSAISDKEPELKLLENRAVISGAGTTGLRTWEAALHLSSYLLSSPELIANVKGKKVIELGAGTGLLSILCASHLSAAHVTATDGDDGVVQALHENVAFNDVKDAMDIGVLWWGRALKGSWMFEKEPSFSCDLVLGADVVGSTSYRSHRSTLILVPDIRQGCHTSIGLYHERHVRSLAPCANHHLGNHPEQRHFCCF